MVCDLGREGGYGIELGIFLFGNAGFLLFHSELVASSVMMVSLW
jgi:hypothetical protein